MIDPGSEPKRIATLIDSHNVKLKGILNTHAHIDHVGGVSELANKFNIPFYLHIDDEELLNNIPQYSKMFSLSIIDIPKVNYYFEERKYTYGELIVEVIFTPGHTKGGVCLLINNHLFTGDTLFNLSIGRTDLPGGNYNELLKSIKKKLTTLSSQTIIYPGHGSNSTIGYEIDNNPFLN